MVSKHGLIAVGRDRPRRRDAITIRHRETHHDDVRFGAREQSDGFILSRGSAHDVDFHVRAECGFEPRAHTA